MSTHRAVSLPGRLDGDESRPAKGSTSSERKRSEAVARFRHGARSAVSLRLWTAVAVVRVLFFVGKVKFFFCPVPVYAWTEQRRRCHAHRPATAISPDYSVESGPGT